MPSYAIVTNDLQVAAATLNEERKRAVAAFLPRQKALLDGLRALDVPVIHLQLVVSDDDPRNATTPDELRYTRGSAGVRLLDETLEESDLVIEKPKDSGFFETTLDETLKKLGVDTVIISGMQAQICVQTTAADAHFRGYRVVIPTDCIVSSNPEDTKQALKWMSEYFATLLPSDEIEQLVRAGRDE
ncbi:isochorismatase family cysteine hydrolase [Streptomyces fulvoviolaceus]|uniref:isochorismatase family cysteine hydrolase n=1 Tax=Streptomyces fulvoviolaceus TaxID=285535 RepID=UPI0021C086DE|nr:isochorismatase family cysteine hydrolase [Streptomyces fulvoviolaceus]MCT9076395.1 cysteine hydrolase [Streptomyces fulvoviolaceus]